MKPVFVATPSGQFLNTQHIVTLDLEGSGTQDQLRHQVFATLSNGDRMELAVFKGGNSHQQAQAMLLDLIGRCGAETYNPKLDR